MAFLRKKILYCIVWDSISSHNPILWLKWRWELVEPRAGCVKWQDILFFFSSSLKGSIVSFNDIYCFFQLLLFLRATLSYHHIIYLLIKLHDYLILSSHWKFVCEEVGFSGYFKFIVLRVPDFLRKQHFPLFNEKMKKKLQLFIWKNIIQLFIWKSTVYFLSKM